VNRGSGNRPEDRCRPGSNGKGFFDGGTQTGGADVAESVAIARAANRCGPGCGCPPPYQLQARSTAQNVLLSFDLVKIFAMRFQKPWPLRHGRFHCIADGTQNGFHADVS
jgi:hypothetical protein